MDSSHTLLSIGRESLVIQEGDRVIKSYRPEVHPQYGDIYHTVFSGKRFHARSMDRKRRESLYRREALLLEWASQASLVPEYLGRDDDKLEITLAYLPQQTYHQAVQSGLLSSAEATGEMVRKLAAVHTHFNQSLAAVRERLVEGGTQLRPWTKETEIKRWVRYLETIVFYESTDLEQYLKDRSIDPTVLKPKNVRKHVRSFLTQRGINLQQRVDDFMVRDALLREGESTFVWEEAKPSNMFYFPDEKRTCVIDFPRARLGAGSDTDLVNVLYHVPREFHLEDELSSVALAKEYFGLMGIPPEEQPVRVARLVAARVKEALRLYANYSQKTVFEIEKMTAPEGSIPLDPAALDPAHYSNGSSTKDDFLNKMFGSTFQHLFDYYRFRSGEGWTIVMEENPSLSPEKKKLIRDQLVCVEDILRESGVLMGVVRSQRRARRFRALVR